jgi:alpha-L-fucosidase
MKARINRCNLWLTIASAALSAAPLYAQPKKALIEETKAQHEARMAWWKEARFGMFIHWGIYSVPAGTYDGKQIPGIGEWIMNRGKIPVARYAEYAKEFNPVKFNAEQWVQTAKNAGMKYIVITSKHHDGFAMFHSATSPYNIYDATPFKRDPIMELAEACKRNGIRFGLYYSQAQDWHHRGGAANGGHWDKEAQDGSFDEYLDKISVPQVREILTKYGPISVLWFDTPTDMTPERAQKFIPVLKLQPQIIVNNRLGGGYDGDLSTPEQYIPATGIPGKDWETCMTMNDTWGYKSYDDHWKSSTDLIQKISDIASKGGNFLLNVGPTSEGVIPAPSVERLGDMGRWMKVNHEAVYGTSAGPFSYLKWGRATRKGDMLYLHVFNWPADGELKLPLKNQVTNAYLLSDASKTKLTATLEGEWVTVKLPAQAPDPVDSVVAIRIQGEPVAIPAPSAGRPGAASSSAGPEFAAEKAFDGNPDTRWKAASGQTSGWLEVTFDKPAKIGHVSMVENGGRGQGIRKFKLEYRENGEWKTALEGDRIGRAFSSTLKTPVTAQTFRLNILESTGAPQIDEMQLDVDQ